jgi:hypothetical protein
MYKSLLRQISDELRRFDERLQPPCNPDELSKLRQKAQRRLFHTVPDQYIAFLSSVNGLCWNGLEVFACGPTPKAGAPEYTIGGYVESNLSYRELGSPDKYLIFAADDICLYVFDLIEKRYQTVTRAGDTVLRSHASFDGLIVNAMKAALGQT